VHVYDVFKKCHKKNIIDQHVSCSEKSIEKAPNSWNLPCKNNPFVYLFSNLPLLQLEQALQSVLSSVFAYF
jgi:hypothetical protein